ncbi:regulator [filamentous cyanobacterium CCP5]|nr:regulator [filamentous cyanobacterium CCP5]
MTDTLTDVLVIDPDPINRQLLSRVLQEQGYGVTLAENGQSGLSQAAQLQPGLIICKWDLPGTVDASKICQTIKNSDQLAATFLLLLTPRHGSLEQIQALDMGADDLIAMPVDGNELKTRVRAGLRLNAMTRVLRQQKQRLEAELLEAESYVRSLLPTDCTGPVPIQGRFCPSQQLGGDGYDYYWLDPDYLAIYLLDVSGHGLGSALLSTSVLNVLRSQSLPDVNFYRPEKVLKALNETFQMSAQNEKYFTIWYGVLNCVNRQLLYASAGHPPAVAVSRHGASAPTIQQLRTSGMPIGMLPEATYRWRRCELLPDSTLYLFSDGLYEIIQNNQECFGLEAFIELLSEFQGQKSVDDILQTMAQKRLDAAATDDMSLVAVTLK